MTANRAPAFCGYKGDACYEYGYLLVTRGGEEYRVLRLRKIEFGGDQNLHDAYRMEFGRSILTKEYGSFRVKDGRMENLNAWGNEEGVYTVTKELRKSDFEEEIRKIFDENRPAVAPVEPPMKHRAVVDYVWADGTRETWEGPERDSGAEAMADTLVATFKPAKPYIVAVPEIKTYPAS